MDNKKKNISPEIQGSNFDNAGGKKALQTKNLRPKV